MEDLHRKLADLEVAETKLLGLIQHIGALIEHEAPSFSVDSFKPHKPRTSHPRSGGGEVWLSRRAHECRSDARVYHANNGSMNLGVLLMFVAANVADANHFSGLCQDNRLGESA